MVGQRGSGRTRTAGMERGQMRGEEYGKIAIIEREFKIKGININSFHNVNSRCV